MHGCQRNTLWYHKGRFKKQIKNSEMAIYEGTSSGTKKMKSLQITSEISLLLCACSPLCFRWPIDFLCFPPGQQNVLSTSRWFRKMTRKNVSSTMLARQFNPADFCPSSFSAFGRITHTITSRLYFSMKIVYQLLYFIIFFPSPEWNCSNQYVCEL